VKHEYFIIMLTLSSFFHAFASHNHAEYIACMAHGNSFDYSFLVNNNRKDSIDSRVDGDLYMCLQRACFGQSAGYTHANTVKYTLDSEITNNLLKGVFSYDSCGRVISTLYTYYDTIIDKRINSGFGEYIYYDNGYVYTEYSSSDTTSGKWEDKIVRTYDNSGTELSRAEYGMASDSSSWTFEYIYKYECKYNTGGKLSVIELLYSDSDTTTYSHEKKVECFYDSLGNCLYWDSYTDYDTLTNEWEFSYRLKFMNQYNTSGKIKSFTAIDSVSSISIDTIYTVTYSYDDSMNVIDAWYAYGTDSASGKYYYHFSYTYNLSVPWTQVIYGIKTNYVYYEYPEGISPAASFTFNNMPVSIAIDTKYTIGTVDSLVARLYYSEKNVPVIMQAKRKSPQSSLAYDSRSLRFVFNSQSTGFVRLYTASGRQVVGLPVKSGHPVNISFLASGAYTARLFLPDGSMRKYGILKK
jgi:hypothetical protein